MFKVPQYQPSAQDVAAQNQANTNDLLNLQKQTGQDTDLLARVYGANSAISGANMQAPVLGR